jgi:UDP-glucose 4-epimerase
VRILVTGATGFIGRHVVDALAGEGHEIVSLSRAPAGPTAALAHIRHDLSQPLDPRALGAIEAVIHLAGHGSVDAAVADPAAAALQNAQTTMQAVQLARHHGARFILASSQRIYRPRLGALRETSARSPTEPYGYTKLVAELYVEMAGRVYGVPGAVLRMFSVYGPGQVITGGQSGVVAIFASSALAGAPLIVMSRQRKDFVEVSDVVQAVGLAHSRPSTPARAYNIGAGRATSVIALARAVRNATASQSPIVEDYRDESPHGLVADIRRARLELGYEPQISLEEGLRRYVRWLRSTRAHPAEGAANTDPAR